VMMYAGQVLIFPAVIGTLAALAGVFRSPFTGAGAFLQCYNTCRTVRIR
jgi:hypothetical protein